MQKLQGKCGDRTGLGCSNCRVCLLQWLQGFQNKYAMINYRKGLGCKGCKVSVLTLTD